MKKQRVILVVITLLFILAVFSLIAANPWRARFKVINLTDADIFIILHPESEDGTDYPQLIARTAPEQDEDEDEVVSDNPTDEIREDATTVFTIDKDTYTAEVIACGMRAQGTIDLTRNLKLNFTECEKMAQYWTPKYHGEPSMEKPNWFKAPGMIEWRFVYEVPPEPIDWEFLGDIE